MDTRIFTKTLRGTFMEETSPYLEGIGHGKIGRIVVGKFKIGVDLLEGIEELAKAESIRTGVILSGIGALEKGVFRNAKVIPPRSLGHESKTSF